jgi:coenzyme F420 biosynthesis associated uncharacterized protein
VWCVVVDWSLAKQVARFAANAGTRAELGDVDFARLAGEAERHLIDYTSLEPAEPVPAPQVVTRPEWAEANVDLLARLLDPVAARLGGRLGAAGPLAGPLRVVAGSTVAAEVGLVVGYMSQRVLGQYELSLLEPEVAPRLLFVGPNLARTLDELEVDRESFLGWIVLHELTHVLQFSGVPWLRPHLAGLLRAYLDSVEMRIERGAAGGMPSLPSLSRLVELFREGGLIALVQSQDERRMMDDVQAAMSVVEGYSEHVMDAVGEHVLASYEGLRAAMEARRRSRSAPERVLQRLLGFDLKMRQYELGKAFCDTVVAKRGIATLNRVWERPESLPTNAELRDPARWISRLEPAAA